MKVLEMDPHFLPVYISLAMAYEKKKWYEKTIAAIEKTREISEYSAHTLSVLAYAYAAFGNRKEAQKVLDGLTELSMKSEVKTDPLDIAAVYSGLGERD